MEFHQVSIFGPLLLLLYAAYIGSSHVCVFPSLGFWQIDNQLLNVVSSTFASSPSGSELDSSPWEVAINLLANKWDTQHE